MTLDIDDSYRHVMVLSTASQRHTGVRRLPDRFGPRGERIAAVQVDGVPAARRVFSELDAPGRCFLVDAERKVAADLLSIAQDALRVASVVTVKANDQTVDALEVVVEAYRARLDGSRAIVVGTGNLASKIALRLAERGVDVGLDGRSHPRRREVAQAINSILPRHTASRVSAEPLPGVDLLVSAVSAAHVVNTAHLDALLPAALCVDVGIDNFSASFIGAALQAGHRCIRLDARAATVWIRASPEFFSTVVGEGTLAGGRAVAGGVVGDRGDLVVDQIVGPTRVIGVANGSGGLVSPEDRSSGEEAIMAAAMREVARHRS